MISANRTGAYISSLRKTRDWTQQELAEKLHVTHQAVSQWEKGASFPDVGLLPELGRLLGVSVDDLLNGAPLPRTHRATPGSLVEEIAHGRPDEAARLVQGDPQGVEAMLTAAPLARPSQMDAVLGSLAGYEFTLRQAMELAPFVSQAALQTLLDRALDGPVEREILEGLAPFVATDTLDKLACQIAAGDLSHDLLGSLAPFLSKPTLKALALDLLNGGSQMPPESLSELAPFLDHETLETFLLHLPDGPLPLEQVAELAPFASQATLERLISRVETPTELGDYLQELAPFIRQSTLQKIIQQSHGRLTPQQVLNLAPFLGQETLDALVLKSR